MVSIPDCWYGMRLSFKKDGMLISYCRIADKTAKPKQSGQKVTVARDDDDNEEAA